MKKFMTLIALLIGIAAFSQGISTKDAYMKGDTIKIAPSNKAKFIKIGNNVYEIRENVTLRFVALQKDSLYENKWKMHRPKTN